MYLTHTQTALVLMLPDILAIHHQTKMQSTKHKSLFTLFILKGPL